MSTGPAPAGPHGPTWSPMSSDRPQVHFTPASGWVNDPLGLTHHDGEYHLFFQHVPGTTRWATEQHWGHATSTDLVRWTEHAPALSPGDGDDGVWSGSLVAPADGRPAMIFYTSVSGPDTHVGRARVARAADRGWTSWRKDDVVATLPEGLTAVAYRDPQVLHDGTSWLMLLGAGLADGTATALAYRSDDLETWTYDGPLLSRHRSVTEPLWTGDAWECPQLVRVGDRWALVVSVWEPHRPRDQVYAIGDLVGGRLMVDAWHPLTAGLCHYAGSAFTDADGRPGLIHWLRGVADPGGTWAGAHSVPHVLEPHGGRLAARPHPALAAARSGPGRTVGASTPSGAAVDVEWAVDGERTATLTVRDDVGPLLTLTADDGALALRTGAGTTAAPFAGGRVRVLVDGPTLEVFTDDGVLGAPLRGGHGLRVLTVSGAGEAVAHDLAVGSAPARS